jgi:hypothetical protein
VRRPTIEAICRWKRSLPRTKPPLVESRRLTKGRQSQAKLAALAFTIKDVGGDRGIIVTPKPLQKGSKLVAQSAGITHFKLDSKSEANNFFAEALGKMFLGIPSLGDTCQFGEPGIGRG